MCLCGGRHSSVNSSAPAVAGSNPINAFSIYSQILYYICHCLEKRTKINKNGPGFPHILLCVGAI